MKKRIAFALAMMMILTSLAACGGKKDDGGVILLRRGQQFGWLVLERSRRHGFHTGSSGRIRAAGNWPTDEQNPSSSAEQNGAAQDTVKTETARIPNRSSQLSRSSRLNRSSLSKPQQKPETKPEPKPEPKPEVPEAKNPSVADVAAAVEGALSVEMSFVELTADDLSTLYGLSASAVEGFQCKMPMMNVQATEYFVAKGGRLVRWRRSRRQRSSVRQIWMQPGSSICPSSTNWSKTISWR